MPTLLFASCKTRNHAAVVDTLLFALCKTRNHATVVDTLLFVLCKTHNHATVVDMCFVHTGLGELPGVEIHMTPPVTYAGCVIATSTVITITLHAGCVIATSAIITVLTHRLPSSFLGTILHFHTHAGCVIATSTIFISLYTHWLCHRHQHSFSYILRWLRHLFQKGMLLSLRCTQARTMQRNR